MKNRKTVVILLVSFVLSTSAALAQQIRQDEAFLESVRTEIHPDREKPEMPDNVVFKPNVIYGNADGHNLAADIFKVPRLSDKYSSSLRHCFNA